MLQGLLGDDTMSNLTSASNEATLTSSSNINRSQEIHQNNNINQPSVLPTKKKRNLPGNPDPDSEVVALSPNTLMATNRFVCEICNKGFQRDQNLQLHKRGHNLPWKLKQRSKTEIVKRKVYVCPEPSCVHHHPSRALGDLTGIKKHFCRKHGEKKWKCEKCSKRYAVQSDWRAHSKICGTREYRCDCGTLFSRRDSFITHRAFCDALAEESSRSMPHANPIFLSNSQTGPNHQFQQNPLIPLLKQENHFNIPPWLLSSDAGSAGPGHQTNQLFTLPRLEPSIQESQNNNNISTNALGFSSSNYFMSATAMLQKAAQMGVTTTTKPAGNHNHMGADAPGYHANVRTAGMPSREDFVNMMGSNNSLPSTSGFNVSFAFDNDSFNGMLNTKRNGSFQEGGSGGNAGGTARGDAGLTRDFLGLRGFPHRDYVNMAGLEQLGSSSYDQQAQNQNQWHASN